MAFATHSRWLVGLVWIVVCVGHSIMISADDNLGKPVIDPKTGAVIDPGHSGHGEVFDEGPRQRAYLMGNTGVIVFPITTKSPEAQQYFLQGVGQLHGFWYFEAERSFRQAAALDPDCAMAYWGMAQANLSNEKRAAGFIARAVERKKNLTRLENMWIDALRAYIPEKTATAKDEKKDDKKPAPAQRNTIDTARRKKLIKDLEAIVQEFPDDLEAKAFLVKHIWTNSSSGIPISSHMAVNALITEILAMQPMHPAHHYKIHLWDDEKPSMALPSAALCGQAAPNIAHMWHMPGHTFSNLKRYEDAAWQQEASSRVDHAHMIHDQILPDQIHNYAHNQDWLAKNLTFIGRVHESIALAKNLVELPRHPKYNSLSKGSARMGRSRLINTLVRFELWDELLALANTRYLEPTDLNAEQILRLKVLGIAWFNKGELAKGEEQITALTEKLDALKAEKAAAIEKAEAASREKKETEDQIKKAGEKAGQPFADKMKPYESAIKELNGHRAIAKSDWNEAWDQLKPADAGLEYMSRARLAADDEDEALRLAREAVQKGTNEVYPQANLVDILYGSGEVDEAKTQFEKLRGMSSQIDLDLPIFQRLKPLVKELGLADDWRQARPTPGDIGVRPELASLGPFTWHPFLAAPWSLPDSEERNVSLAQFQGKPVVVIFYLGVGCLHCVEQLKAFAPMAKEYEASGISIVAISTDDIPNLKKTLERKPGDPEVTFPLVSDPEMNVFKAYRAYDDFEDLPLHATLLIDGDGYIRWQDISYEPFADAKYLLSESQRLLGSNKVSIPAETAAAGE